MINHIATSNKIYLVLRFFLEVLWAALALADAAEALRFFLVFTGATVGVTVAARFFSLKEAFDGLLEFDFAFGAFTFLQGPYIYNIDHAICICIMTSGTCSAHVDKYHQQSWNETANC